MLATRIATFTCLTAAWWKSPLRLRNSRLTILTRVGLVFVAAILCTSAQLQPPASSPALEEAPAFEVASVKRHPLKPGQFIFRVAKPGGIPFEITGNRVLEQFASAEQLVMDAYDVKDY